MKVSEKVLKNIKDVNYLKFVQNQIESDNYKTSELWIEYSSGKVYIIALISKGKSERICELYDSLDNIYHSLVDKYHIRNN